MTNDERYNKQKDDNPTEFGLNWQHYLDAISDLSRFQFRVILVMFNALIRKIIQYSTYQQKISL